MRRTISPSAINTRFEPVMLSLTDSAEVPSASKSRNQEEARTWSDRQREIDQLEDPERWDGLS